MSFYVFVTSFTLKIFLYKLISIADSVIYNYLTYLLFSGKWWGKENPNVFLALHGWQDNAGTWDTLIPLLSSDISVLAIDSPGHGFSSHLQPGLVYHNIESLKFLRLVVKYFNWEQVSFLAHSAGAIQAFIYSSIFPENVDKLIALDTLKPTSAKPEKEVRILGKKIDQFLDIIQYDESKAPIYSYEELLTRLSDGAVKNSLTKGSAKILLKRGATPVGDDKYQLNRDIRLKTVQFIGLTHEQILEMAANITSKILYIKGSNGLQIEDPQLEQEIIHILQKSAEGFEKHVVQGTHHVHLNSPHEVAPIINHFINKT